MGSWIVEEAWDYYNEGNEIRRDISVSSGSPSAPATEARVSDYGSREDGDWMEIEFFVDAPAR